jgi:hypothetical protein
VKDSTYHGTQLKLFTRSAQAEMETLAPKKMAVWKNRQRAIANELARSSLFSCRNPKLPRLHYANHKLFSLDRTTIFYDGEELRSNDKEVWLALAHAARGVQREKGATQIVLKLSSNDICKLIGWQCRKHHYVEIYRSIIRMKATSLNIQSLRLKKARAYEQARLDGATEEELASLYAQMKAAEASKDPSLDKMAGLVMSMIGDGVEYEGEVVDGIPKGNLQWTIPLNIGIMALFAWSYLTLIPYELRQKIPYGVATNLLEYFLSNKEPHGIYMSNLAKMLNLGSELRENKRIIAAALEKLVAAGALESFYVEPGRGNVKVHVIRAAWKDDDEDDEGGATDPQIGATDPQSGATDPQTP